MAVDLEELDIALGRDFGTKYDKLLVAVGNDTVYYEDSTVPGTMTAITGATDIDTTDQLVIFEAYSKVFVINGAILRVADFGNTKITTTDIKTTGSTYPTRGMILEGSITTTDRMLVDFCTVTDGAGSVYGRMLSGAFDSGDTVVASAADGGATAVSFVLSVAPAEATTMPHWYTYTAYAGNGGSYGSLPNKAYLGCLYRGRVVLAGDPVYPHQWYMSRQANPWDWVYAANDAQSPVAGNNADAGEVGDVIRCLIPYKDDYLIFGCTNTISVLRGDAAAGGSIDAIDLTTGIYGPNSYCWDNANNLYFWGTGGIYKMTSGLKVENLSAINLPNLLEDSAATPTTHRITMAFDRDRQGVIIAVTTIADGHNSNFWYDLRTGGFFPESYPHECGPYSLFYYDSNTLANKGLLVGCRDGYIRTYKDTTMHDDIGATNEAIDSYVVLGPIKIARDDDSYGRLQSFTAVLGNPTDTDDVIDYVIKVDEIAETVITDISTSPPTPPVLFTGTIVGGGRVQKYRTRARGTYLGIRLGNDVIDKTWAFEKLIGEVVEAGGI
jgi:hypothetical protein